MDEHCQLRGLYQDPGDLGCTLPLFPQVPDCTTEVNQRLFAAEAVCNSGAVAGSKESATFHP